MQKTVSQTQIVLRKDHQTLAFVSEILSYLLKSQIWQNRLQENLNCRC